MKNIFDQVEASVLIERINNLDATTQSLWGKMNVAQMLAHSNVAFEITYENIHVKPGALMKIILKLIVKPFVVGEKPYKRNSRTGPQFMITEQKDFALEKNRLVDYIKRTQELGAVHFEGKKYQNFGKLAATEWSTMFYKHLDHHLNQFGV